MAHETRRAPPVHLWLFVVLPRVCSLTSFLSLYDLHSELVHLSSALVSPFLHGILGLSSKMILCGLSSRQLASIHGLRTCATSKVVRMLLQRSFRRESAVARNASFATRSPPPKPIALRNLVVVAKRYSAHTTLEHEVNRIRTTKAKQHYSETGSVTSLSHGFDPRNRIIDLSKTFKSLSASLGASGPTSST